MISTEPSDNMREILQNIAKSHGVSNMRKLGHLNNFVKVVQLLFVLVVVQRLVYATLMHDFSVEIWSCVIRCLHLFFFALILGEMCWIVNVNMVECIKWSWEYYVLIDHWKHCKMSTKKIKLTITLSSAGRIFCRMICIAWTHILCCKSFLRQELWWIE